MNPKCIARVWIVGFLLVSFFGYAQDEKWFKKGESFLNSGNFGAALDCFKQAHEADPKNSLYLMRLAQCYLQTIEKNQSIKFANMALQLAQPANNELFFTLARAFHINHYWDSAMVYYRKSDIGNINKKEISKKIKECENGLKYASTPTDAKIINAGDKVNSAYHDYLPYITADRAKLYFTSRRPDSYGGKKDTDGKYFEDIYSCANIGGAWDIAKNIGQPLNTEIHDACVGLSDDGQTMFVYKGDNGGDIYITQLKGQKWSKPEPLSINTEAFESSACLSADERTLYFVRKLKEGNKDIYYCSKTLGGSWSKPKRWELSTDFDDDFPFLHPDGKTIYFSSKGHTSMGGYDIFKSTKGATGRWENPVNLGSPINSAGDDIYFVLSADGKVGFYSSDKAGGLGLLDIYSIRMPSNEQSPNLTLLKGTITNANKKPIQAQITIIDNDSKEVISKFQSNENTGQYLVALPSGKNYGIQIDHSNMLFYSDNIMMREKDSFKELVKNIVLSPIQSGEKVVLKNIFFASGDATIQESSMIELQKLKLFLSNNPTIRIEVSGHTDNIGDEKLNKSLSQQRADKVVQYLIGEGIQKNRLVSLGYGSTHPIANNDSESGRKQNRRTEFKIL